MLQKMLLRRHGRSLSEGGGDEDALGKAFNAHAFLPQARHARTRRATLTPAGGGSTRTALPWPPYEDLYCTSISLSLEVLVKTSCEGLGQLVVSAAISSKDSAAR